MLNFRPFLYVYEFLHAPLPRKILHLVSYKMLDFTSFLNLIDWYIYMISLVALKIGKAIIF